MNSQKLEEVTSFKYLGATLCKNSTCSAEVRIRIASAMAAKQNLVVHHHQLHKQVQAVQVFCHLHSPLCL